jgi:hypothetical protein
VLLASFRPLFGQRSRSCADISGSGSERLKPTAYAEAALRAGPSFRKAISFAAAPTGTPRGKGAFYSLSSEREEAMQDRFKFKSAPETLGLFAIVLVMIIFGAAIFYEGASFKQKRTAQFAVSDWNP